MGRRRKASLMNGTGKRHRNGRRLPGYYVQFSEYTPTGRRIQRRKHFLSLRAAREWVKRFNARIDLKLLDEIVPLSLAEAVVEFSKGLAPLAPSTRVHYISALGMLSAIVPGVDLCDIKGADIDSFVAARLRVSTPSTTAKHLRGLHRFFAWAIERRYASHNPVDAATTVPRGQWVRQKPIISEASIAALVTALDTEDRRIAVWIAMTTGLDRGVIMRLNSSQVDIERGVISIRRPKTGKAIDVPIHPLIAPLLAARLDGTDAARPLLAGLARERADRDWWRRATRAAGLEGLLFRDLRALASTRLQRLGGASLRDAQQLLGHSSIQTTAGHYHVPDPAIVRSLERLTLPGHPAGASATAPPPESSSPQAS